MGGRAASPATISVKIIGWSSGSAGSFVWPRDNIFHAVLNLNVFHSAEALHFHATVGNDLVHVTLQESKMSLLQKLTSIMIIFHTARVASASCSNNGSQGMLKCNQTFEY